MSRSLKVKGQHFCVVSMATCPLACRSVCVCVCVCVCPNVAVTLYFIASQTLLVGLQSLAITEFRSAVPGKHARSVADYRRACKQTQPAPCTKPRSLTLINKWSKYFNTRPHRRRTRAVQSYSPVCAPI